MLKCPNPKYIQLSQDVLHDHLLGKITIGVYPLCKDETCYFLVADFDKSGWADDAKAFLKACRDMNVPAALERSRSGKGGHVWIFFSEVISAMMARKLGSAILTRTMDSRHQLGLDSYDRFFPNQDTLPKGGFGNLIALPLQRNPRTKGNSLFVNDDLVAYSDQWNFLASIKKMDGGDVESLVREATHSGNILGVRLSLNVENADEDPWTLPPSKKRSEKPIEGFFPPRVSLTRSNLLYIDKKSLPSQALNRIMRIAAFQNPEFYKAQAMRLSTFDKPKIISCAEEFPRHIALPRGCLEDLRSFFKANSVGVTEKDERNTGEPVEFTFKGTFRPEQEKVASKLIAYEEGVLSVPTGFGKTVLATWLISQRKVNTLILVHRTSLLEQWREQLALFLGIDIKEIGVIGGGKKRPSKKLDVAMIQSLQKKGKVNDVVAQYGQVIVDECHHLSAFTFERIMREVKARYVLGLTATPIRKDGHHPIIFMQCGPLIMHIHPKTVAATRPFEHRVLFRRTMFSMPDAQGDVSIQDVYHAMIKDADRNAQIIEDVLQALSEGRSPLVLTERVEHLNTLAENLEGKTPNIFVLRGGMGKKKRKLVTEKLKSLTDSDPCVILATGRFAGEGFDVPRLDTLFLAMPISWRGTLQQYVGRLHRTYTGKKEAQVYDYVDQNVPMLQRMLGRRMKGHKAMGYTTDVQLSLPNSLSK